MFELPLKEKDNNLIISSGGGYPYAFDLFSINIICFVLLPLIMTLIFVGGYERRNKIDEKQYRELVPIYNYNSFLKKKINKVVKEKGFVDIETFKSVKQDYQDMINYSNNLEEVDSFLGGDKH